MMDLSLTTNMSMNNSFTKLNDTLPTGEINAIDSGSKGKNNNKP